MKKKSKKFEIFDEDTGTVCKKRFHLLQNAEQNVTEPTALTVRWATHVPLEVRRKLTYRLVDRNEKGAGPYKRPVLIAEGEGLRFISNPLGPDTEVYRGVVCIENETTNSVRFLATNNYCLYPDFSHKKKAKTEESETAAVKAEPSYREKKENLISDFGSSKGHRLVNAHKRNAMVSKTAMQVDVAKAITESVPLTLDMMGSMLAPEERAPLTYMPPYHLDAKSPTEVYLFTDLLTEDEIDSLSSFAQTFINADDRLISTWQQQEKYSNFVMNYLRDLPRGGEERKRRCVILSYFHFLLVLCKMKAVDWKRKDSLLSDFPNLVKQKVLTEFTKSTARPEQKSDFRYVPKELKDKMFLYLCVVALILHDFSLDLKTLEEDTGKKLRIYFEQLGCKVITQKGRALDSAVCQRVVLRTPLTFPKPRGVKRKAK